MGGDCRSLQGVGKRKSLIFVEVESTNGEASQEDVLDIVVAENVENQTLPSLNCFNVVVDQIVISNSNATIDLEQFCTNDVRDSNTWKFGTQGNKRLLY